MFYHHRIFSIIAVLFLVVLSSTVNAAIIRVDHQSNTNGPGDLTNWSNAYDNLEDALDGADPGDIIWVADGEYFPTERTDVGDPTSVVFRMREDVVVLGGFEGLSRSGSGETLESQRNPELHETFLSGDIDHDGYDSGNAETIVFATSDTITDSTRLNGFTIRDAWGRGITIGTGAWPVIARCVITNNDGGAVIDNAVPGIVLIPPEGPARFLSCTFADNHSSYHGGGAFVLSGSASFMNCLAHDNTCDNAGSFTYNAADYAEYINCTIVGNSTETDADSGGGAVNCGTGETVIVGCIIRGNVCGDPEDDGEEAQISVPSSATLDVGNCDIQGLDEFAGNNNFDVDPLFVDAGNDDYGLEYLSVALNSGDPSDMPADGYDIDSDSDSDTSEALPDRGMSSRKVNTSDCIDVGALENQIAGSCLCDITDDSNGEPDGDVGDPDLDLVLDAWGTPGGVADVEPDPCGNGIVNVDDMLLVINNWGSCSSSFSGPGDPPTLEEIIVLLQAFAVEHPEHEDLIEAIIVELLNDES